jgi:phosphatidylethanolamine-binding protein (PEBP) family uncharacterized protein
VTGSCIGSSGTSRPPARRCRRTSSRRNEPADPAGAKQAPSPFGNIGYLGPCSEDNINTYEFTIYAIDVATLPGLDQNSLIMEAEQAVVDAALASATLSGES